MKRILFPTAYTSHSKVAYRYAQRLAHYFDAEITLVHIYESPSAMLASNVELMNELETKDLNHYAENQWSEELRKLKTFASEMAVEEFEDIALDFITTDGEVVSELLEIQNQNNFDLIILGMRKHNLADRLFGNTTYTLIDKVDCPLLLIPVDAHYMGIDKIVYGTAFSLGDVKAIEHLLEWCNAFKSKLHLVHVERYTTGQETSAKMKALVEQFPEEKETKVISYQLLEGEIARVMEDYVEISGADMLAIHRRKQGFWQEIKEGSLTKVLAEEVKVPLLVLKSEG